MSEEVKIILLGGGGPATAEQQQRLEEFQKIVTADGFTDGTFISAHKVGQAMIEIVKEDLASLIPPGTTPGVAEKVTTEYINTTAVRVLGFIMAHALQDSPQQQLDLEARLVASAGNLRNMVEFVLETMRSGETLQ